MKVAQGVEWTECAIEELASLCRRIAEIKSLIVETELEQASSTKEKSLREDLTMHFLCEQL